MGFFGKLFAGFKGAAAGAQASAARRAQDNAQAPVPAPEREPTFTVTYSMPDGPSVPVSDAEVAERVSQYAFVLGNDLPLLKTADQWWEEETQNRRRRDGSEKAYAWLLPFLPIELAKLEPLQTAQEWGPHGAAGLAKEIRVLIRERRKLKQPHDDLLRALFGVSVAAGLSDSLRFEGGQPHNMARFVDIRELQLIALDYTSMGYQCSSTLSKTDVKWLVAAFGEPAEHQSFDVLWPHIRENAISRYCWAEVGSSNTSSKSLGLPQKTMQEWLNELVKRNIGYHKEWLERNAAREVLRAAQASALDEAWAATAGTFVVADLETTGLDTEFDEVLEFAAVQVDAGGTVLREFTVLVQATRPIPAVITKLTGITQRDIDREGQPLAHAMRDFLSFVGKHPVFFHNAPFDAGFMKSASARAKLKFDNSVHDTLPMARQVWPSLGTYKLAALAEHVGAPAPSHRALADVKATLAVLLAARQKRG
jgi:DNA polymerase-3 subunit epsilon